MEPGETVNLNATLRNAGDAAATGVGATLSSSTAGVTVPQPSSPYPDMAATALGTNSSPFRVAVAATVACGETLNLGLAVTSAHGAFTVPVPVPTGASGPSAQRTSTDVPKAIPDNGTATSTLAVAEAGQIKDVNVTIAGITHTWVGDLKLELVGPDGTTVVLASRPGGTSNSGDDFANTVFDDEAAGTIASGTPPYSGSFRPDQPLAAFDGKEQQGTWTLRVSDLAEGDTGTLTGWGTTTTLAVCDLNAPPAAAFTVTPNPAQVGQSVSFDGSGSADPDGTVVRYQWDLDGNGSFETDTGATATTARTYAAPGVVDVRLRVTDGDGATGEATRSLPVDVRPSYPAPLPVPVPTPLPVPASPSSAFPGCPERTTTVRRGTRGADTITGTAAGDRIFAAPGDDLVRGLSGDDCIDLGAGTDRGDGGPGNDLIVGGAGRDRLGGGAGGDRIAGGGSRDTIGGGSGGDRVSGGSGNDRLSGGAGNDRLNGGSGRDSISGGSGNDRIGARDRKRDRIRCGRGRDSAVADRHDRVARDCERVRRR